MSASLWETLVPVLMSAALGSGVTSWWVLRSSRDRRTRTARTAMLRDQALLPPLGREDSISLNSLDESTIKYFLALDEGSAMQLYSQTTESAKVASLREEETTDGIDGSGRISLGSFGLTGKKNRASRITETFEPESDPLKALAVATKQLLDEGNLRHIDLTATPSFRPLDRLVESIERRAKQIGLTVPPEAIVAIRGAWDASRNESTDGTLRQLRGFVKIKADFTARYDETGDLILEASKDSSNRTVSVVVTTRKELLTQSAESTITPGATLHAICFGNTGQWNDKSTSLSITPIAIYSA